MGIWELIQKWHILKYIELRCRIGLDSYVVESNKKDKKSQAKDIREVQVDVGLSSDEESDEEDLPMFKRKKGSLKKKKSKNKKGEEKDSTDQQNNVHGVVNENDSDVNEDTQDDEHEQNNDLTNKDNDENENADPNKVIETRVLS